MNIYINGHILDENKNMQEAFVEKDGKFIFVGSSSKALQYQGNVISLEGKYVLPGFNDSHMHLVGYGQSLKNLQLANVTSSLKEVLQTVKDNLPTSGWLVGRGWNQDYFQDEKRFITKYDLDQISTSIPICLTRACGHILVANSKAIALASSNQQIVEGGSYNLETGIFKENALSLIYDAISTPTKEIIKEYILLAQQQLNTYGITSIQSDDLVSVTKNYQDVLDAFEELEKEHKLTVRIYEQSQLVDLETLKEFIGKGYHTGVGNEYFKIGPLKMLGDGSLGARTAFLSQPYKDDPNTSGQAIYTKQQIKEMFDYANTHQMQIAIHAIGDGILDWIIEGYQYALAKYPRKDHRHGIVHCQITRKEQLEAFANLHLHGYIQSIFLDYDTHIVEQRVNPVVAKTSYHFKTLKEYTTISNGSDCPVELPDVLKGMQLAITRTSLDGMGPYLQSQALTKEEALDSFTKDGAYASFEENIKGSIKEGMLADFVVVDKNILETDANKIKDIKVLQTYIGGKLVYSRGESND